MFFFFNNLRLWPPLSIPPELAFVFNFEPLFFPPKPYLEFFNCFLNFALKQINVMLEWELDNRLWSEKHGICRRIMRKFRISILKEEMLTINTYHTEISNQIHAVFSFPFFTRMGNFKSTIIINFCLLNIGFTTLDTLMFHKRILSLSAI